MNGNLTAAILTYFSVLGTLKGVANLYSTGASSPIFVADLLQMLPALLDLFAIPSNFTAIATAAIPLYADSITQAIIVSNT